MPFYQRKPHVCEAWRVQRDMLRDPETPKFVHDLIGHSLCEVTGEIYTVNTEDGWATAYDGDWIAVDQDGYRAVYHDHEFAEHYVPLTGS
jgi:hypothetical protein